MMEEMEDINSGFDSLSLSDDTEDHGDPDTQGEEVWKSDSVEAFREDAGEFFSVMSGTTVSQFAGKDFEVDFRTQLDEGDILSDDSVGYKAKEEADTRFIWEQYQSGMWAPYPEFYLAEDAGAADEDRSVFEQLKAGMVLITEQQDKDRYIHKRIVREGSGIPVGRKEIVVVHYAAYVEYADEPVDVAYSRAMKRSFKLQVDQGNALPGFEMAIKSMHQGEAAIFIVSSTLAYGRFGCPPRYPGGADIFYFIELVAVSPNDPLELAMQLPSEEREHLDFTAVKTLLAKCLARVDFFYKQSEYRRAQSYQRWSIDLLEHCHTADEVEDRSRLKLLQSALSNGAVIAHKLRLPKAVMYHTGSLLKMDRKNRKALYLRILALIELKDQQEALTLCKRGAALFHDTDQFTKLLEKLQHLANQEKDRERDLYARMLGNVPPPPTAKTVESPKTEKPEKNTFFVNKFQKIVEDFKKSDVEEMVMSIEGFTFRDIQNLEAAAMTLDVDTEYDKYISVRLRKPTVPKDRPRGGRGKMQ